MSEHPSTVPGLVVEATTCTFKVRGSATIWRETFDAVGVEPISLPDGGWIADIVALPARHSEDPAARMFSAKLTGFANGDEAKCEMALAPAERESLAATLIRASERAGGWPGVMNRIAPIFAPSLEMYVTVTFDVLRKYWRSDLLPPTAPRIVAVADRIFQAQHETLQWEADPPFGMIRHVIVMSFSPDKFFLTVMGLATFDIGDKLFETVEKILWVNARPLLEPRHEAK